jgi:hypothetical protein
MQDKLKLLRDNWQAVSSLFFLSIHAVMGFIPTFQNFAFLPLSAAIASLVLMVWALNSKEKGGLIRIKRYAGGIQEAFDDAMKAMDRSSLRVRPRNLQVRIIGCRLRDVDTIMGRIVNRPLQKIEFEIYHVDEQFLKQQPWPNALDEAGGIHATRRAIENKLSKFKDNEVTVKFYSYKTDPTHYAYIIDDDTVFWGYFKWSTETHTFLGPHDPCQCAQRGGEGFEDIFYYLLSCCERWTNEYIRKS